jgi:glutamate synthase (ferredoxin)
MVMLCELRNMDNPINNNRQNQPSQSIQNTGYPYGGQPWLVEERDACGVGFIANPEGIASHDIVVKALPALTCLEHRGGCSADQDSGDGAGIMTAIPWELFQQAETLTALKSVSVEQLQDVYGVGMVFLPQTPEAADPVRQTIETVLTQQQLSVCGWRPVPIDPDVLGPQARENQPIIEQVIVSSAAGKTGDELERQLYVARRSIGDALAAKGLVWGDSVYICSFSCRTIIYKGMVRSAILGEFYLDLKNPAYKSAFAVYHRRFSTNTMPRWPLANPCACWDIMVKLIHSSVILTGCEPGKGRFLIPIGGSNWRF